MSNHSKMRKCKGARFVRFYPSDWRSGCIGLSPEEEGIYIRVCAHAWETGCRLPLDDRLAASRLMIDVRMWRRVKGQLIEKGKLSVGEDGIYNSRSEHELAEATAASEKAEKRVGADRRVHDGEHQNGGVEVSGRDAGKDTVKAEVSEKSPRSLGEVSNIFAKKENEINGPFIEPITNSHNHKERPPLTPLGGFEDDVTHGVEVLPDGSVRLINGTRAFWLAEFGNDEHRLALALKQITIQPKSQRPIRAQVESQLARQAAQRRDQDTRYGAAVARNAAKAAKPRKLSRWADV